MNTLYPTVKGEDVPAFSIGWLQKFKNRHGIRMHYRFGESGSVDVKALKNRLPEIHAADIYNMDETGLSYRLQADSSLSTYHLEGQKQSKERMMMTVCSNADESDKFLLWVIGKFLNPRCFKNVDCRSLVIAYHANKNAWMTRNVFKLWLEAFVKHVAGRRVILILDNCSAHIKEEDL